MYKDLYEIGCYVGVHTCKLAIDLESEFVAVALYSLAYNRMARWVVYWRWNVHAASEFGEGLVVQSGSAFPRRMHKGERGKGGRVEMALRELLEQYCGEKCERKPVALVACCLRCCTRIYTV